MERTEIFEKIKEICRDVFDNDELVITEATTAADIEEWDSLTHLNLINDMEETFGIAFTLGEIAESQNIGGLVTALMKHLEEKK